MKICNEEGVHYAALWIIACMHLHAYAMDHEDSSFITRDRFYKEGHKIMWREQCNQRDREQEEETESGRMDVDDEDEDIELLEGKLKQEELKKELLAWIDGISNK